MWQQLDITDEDDDGWTVKEEKSSIQDPLIVSETNRKNDLMLPVKSFQQFLP